MADIKLKSVDKNRIGEYISPIININFKAIQSIIFVRMNICSS